MKKIFLILFTLLILGCSSTNPYADMYVKTSEPDMVSNDKLPLADSDITVINSKDTKEDMVDVYENGYEMIGYSSFNTGDLSEKYVRTQALDVGATLVIYSKKFVSQDSELEPVFLNGFCYGGYYSVNCTGADWQYVLKSRYDYLATFWIKTKLSGLGILVRDISQEKRKELGINYGVEIQAIRKDSEARDELALGDVIIKIGENDIKNKEDYKKITDENKGKKIKIEILRKNKTISKEISVL